MLEGIKVSVKKEDKCKRILDIEVSNEDVAKEIERTINEVQKIANIPGFRVGKVPRNLVIQYYRERIEKDALDKLIQDSYRIALNKENIVPVNQAEIKDIKYEKDKPLFFNVGVEVKPEIKFRYYKNIEVDEERVRVDEKDVDDVLKNIQERLAEYTTIENRLAQKGDVVTVDFVGFNDGKQLEKFHGKDLKFEIGANNIIKEIEENTIGMSIGNEKEIQVKLPKEYYVSVLGTSDKELQDKEILVKIKLKSISEKKLPVLDDEFAKDVGECESLAFLREKIENDIRKNRNDEKKGKVEQKILKELVSITAFDVPDSLVERELGFIMDDIKDRMKRENRNFDSLKTTEDEVREKYRQIALEKVKAELILEELSKLENVEVTEDEIKNEVANISSRIPRGNENMLEYFSSDTGKERVKYDIMLRKTLDFLYNNAKINWK